MIQFINVTKQFEQEVIINQLNLTIETGEKIAIIGPSGCGKSTLLRLLIGLQPMSSGEIWVDGKSVEILDRDELSQIRLKFGVLFQSGALFDSMTVEENIGFSLMENLNWPKEKVDSLVKEKLRLVDMEGYETHMPAELSGGQKKRIGLARAIAAEPEILLYDEPTTGLDPISSTRIENQIVELNKTLNCTSIVVTHQHSTILRTADKIYMMDKGQLLDPETPATIRDSQNPIIHHFFHGGIVE